MHEALAFELTQCHWLLLRIAGRVPDDLMSQCRAWLGQGRALDVGRIVASAVVSQQLPLSDADVGLLSELLALDGVDPAPLALLRTTDTERLPGFAFAPTRRRALLDTGAAVDTSPGPALVDALPEDSIDGALLAATQQGPEIRAVWRAWRSPGDGAPWPPPRRVFSVETDAHARLWAITADLQAALSAAGESNPQVEVLPADASPPGYQFLARIYGGLMWARHRDPGIRVATVLVGPPSSLDRLEPAEVERVLEYLRSGRRLPITAGFGPDLLDAARLLRVPVDYATDGEWVWSDATAYYLEHHGVSPEPLFLAHIRSRRYRVGLVDGAGLHRALAAVQAVLQSPQSDPLH